MKSTFRNLLILAAIVLPAILITTFILTRPRPNAPVLGTWIAPSGFTLTFNPDGTFAQFPPNSSIPNASGTYTAAAGIITFRDPGLWQNKPRSARYSCSPSSLTIENKYELFNLSGTYAPTPLLANPPTTSPL